MKKITYVKLGLDIVMAVMFVLLFNKQVFGGLSFHEIAGLVIAGVFFIHILLNWSWVKTITLKLFNNKIPLKTKFSYILNILLLITLGFIIISGIIISRVVFPNLTIGNEQWFKIAHMSISYLGLLLIAIHIGLHWKWVIKVFKDMFKIKTPKRNLGFLLKGVTIAICLYGSYQIYSTHFIMQLQGVANVFHFSSSEIEKGGFKGGEKPNFRGEESFSPQESEIKEGEGSSSQESELKKGESSSFKGGNFKEGGELFDKFDHPREGFKGGKGQSNSPNVFNVILTYFSIISVFVTFIYYLEKFIVNKKRKKRQRYLEV